jgi:ubiquinone/menaquinone biosynthesis C-methylase UbiE
MGINGKETQATKARYNRLAPVYDQMEFLAELRFRPWRQKLWSRVPPGSVLEVGVGTGKNMPFYPDDVRVVGIDLSSRMLAQARERAREDGAKAELHEMDAQNLAFEDNSFDAAIATFVFCSVPDALRGLEELARVVKADGQIVLLEHMRVNQPVIGSLMDLLNPAVVRIMGANINRRTEENVRRAGLVVERVEELAAGGLVQLIVARPAK